MRCNCINCYKCFHEAFCNKPAICNNLLSQDPSSKTFITDDKTKVTYNLKCVLRKTQT